MANTEKLAVLKKIRTLKKKIQTLKSQSDHPAKVELEKAYTIFDDLEDELIFSELDKKVKEIENASNNLKEVIKTAKAKSDDLDEIAARIDKLTDVLVKLTDIAGKAADILL